VKATVIRITSDPSKPHEPEFPGWLVPDTDDTLAVDLRIPADLEYMEPSQWYITHIPTGRRINYGLYTEASTRERAVEIAQNFYREMSAIGCHLKSTDPSEVVRAVNTLEADAKRALWTKIAGWEQRQPDSAPAPIASDQPGCAE
jgi:hypothetical protein